MTATIEIISPSVEMPPQRDNARGPDNEGMTSMPEQGYLPTITDWAWAAGLFEGEGYIGNREYPRKTGGGAWARTLVLSMTDEDVVQRFQRIVGAGSIYNQRRSKYYANAKPLYRWQVSRWDDIERILSHFLPYLGERRAVAARESLSMPPPGPRTHCFKGHELTPENTYVWKDHRACRTCIKARRKRKKEEST